MLKVCWLQRRVLDRVEVVQREDATRERPPHQRRWRHRLPRLRRHGGRLQGFHLRSLQLEGLSEATTSFSPASFDDLELGGASQESLTASGKYNWIWGKIIIKDDFKRSSVYDVMAIGGRGQWFCDDSTKSLVLTDGGGGQTLSKIA